MKTILLNPNRVPQLRADIATWMRQHPHHPIMSAVRYAARKTAIRMIADANALPEDRRPFATKTSEHPFDGLIPVPAQALEIYIPLPTEDIPDIPVEAVVVSIEPIREDDADVYGLVPSKAEPCYLTILYPTEVEIPVPTR